MFDKHMRVYVCEFVCMTTGVCYFILPSGLDVHFKEVERTKKSTSQIESWKTISIQILLALYETFFTTSDAKEIQVHGVLAA